MATLYQQRTAARRATSGIDRLTKEYERQMRDLAERQTRAFEAYTQQTSQTMAPYEAEMAAYTSTLLPEYERQLKSYNEQLAAYQARVREELSKPVDLEAGTQYRQVTTPAAVAPASTNPFMFSGFMNAPIMGGPTEGTTFEEVPIYDVPKFTAEAPKVPAVPKAPTVSAFDTSAYAAETAQLQERLQRELGERRGARMAAVQRRPRGGLMSGV